MTNLRNNGFAADEIRRDEGFAERHVLNDNGGLSSFHHFEEEEEGSNRAKMIGGALVVALLLGGAGHLYVLRRHFDAANHRRDAGESAGSDGVQHASSGACAGRRPCSADG